MRRDGDELEAVTAIDRRALAMTWDVLRTARGATRLMINARLVRDRD